MTGVYTDNQPDFTWLKPMEEKRFTQYFMPYKTVGAVKNASIEAMVGLDADESEIVLPYTQRRNIRMPSHPCIRGTGPSG